MNTFVRGQRWLSETQPELGLGLIEAVEHRRVHLLFPATGERRTYATDVAPLARARFGVGDAIRDLAGNDWVVTGVSDEGAAAPAGPARLTQARTTPASPATGGLLTYQVRDAAGRRDEVPEGALDPRLRLNRPQQRLLAARLDSNAWFRLRLATWRQRQQAATSPVRGLVGARIHPIPHQLYIAAEVADRAAPRVLLADEVGLGKTIEAGLILHRLLLMGRVQRVLILVPDALLHQWLVELLRRFNLRFALFDRARLAALSAGDNGDIGEPAIAGTTGNPFDSEQRVLCSLDLLTADPANAAAALAGHWDLLIVDEAHHLHWTPTAASPAYQLVAGLAERTPGVLLLTATPEQLGRAGHFGRLRLLDPDRFGDYDAFLAEEAGYAPVAEIAARLLDGLDLSPPQQQHLRNLLGAPDAALDRDETVARLLDRHGTSRILFRNTRAAIAGFPERRLHPAPLAPPPLADSADPASPPITISSTLALWPERGWGDVAAADDPRLPWLIETLRRLRPAKVLLITAHANTVLALRRTLLERAGIHGAVFHEGMEIVERDRAAAFFADPDEGSQVLLCSEIGSEGRNFQFVHHLILFDLPLDPELLEQRIGRLDRIGQTHAVDLHVPYVSGGPGEHLYRWYADGLAAFTAPSHAAAAVYERLGGRLHRLLGLPPPAVDADTAADAAAGVNIDSAEPIDRLIADATELRAELEAALAAGRDRLLELGSHRPALSQTLVDAIVADDQDPMLRDYLNRFWDAFGIEHEPGRGGSTVLRPGAHMLEEGFPGLPEDGLTACFDRQHALAHEDHAFLTREHPLVRSAMDLVTGAELGSTAVWLTRHPRFPTGALLLEVIAIADCPAPPDLHAERFLPPTVLRLLLDEQGRDLAGADANAEGDAAAIPSFDPDRGPGRCLHNNRQLATALITARAKPIAALIAAAEPRLQTAVADLRQRATARMQHELANEIDRLQALAAVNPMVRPTDVTALGERRDQLATALGEARLRLDALRLIAFT